MIFDDIDVDEGSSRMRDRKKIQSCPDLKIIVSQSSGRVARTTAACILSVLIIGIDSACFRAVSISSGDDIQKDTFFSPFVSGIRGYQERVLWIHS